MFDSPSQNELLWMARDVLIKAIQNLGLECYPRGLTILCSEMPIQVHCFDVYVSEMTSAVSLAVQVSLGGSPRAPVISECIMGHGKDLEDALWWAAFHWMVSVFVAAVAWYDPAKCSIYTVWDEPFDFEDWYGQVRTWRVISSSAVTVGDFDDIPQKLSTRETLMPLFKQVTRFPGVHWVKATVINGPCACYEASADCTVDNVTSEEGKRLLISSATLPKAPLLRQFHILTSTDTQAPGTKPLSSRLVKVSARNWKHLICSVGEVASNRTAFRAMKLLD